MPKSCQVFFKVTSCTHLLPICQDESEHFRGTSSTSSIHERSDHYTIVIVHLSAYQCPQITHAQHFTTCVTSLTATFFQVAWSSDSRMFVSASKDSTLKVSHTLPLSIHSASMSDYGRPHGLPNPLPVKLFQPTLCHHISVLSPPFWYLRRAPFWYLRHVVE